MRPTILTRTGLALVVTVALTLAGCSPAPEPRPWPTQSTREPVFSSLDEAFEAAVAVLQRYVDLSNQISSEGGVDPGRLFEVVEPGQWADEEIATFELYQDQGIRVEGAGRLTKPRLMQYQDASSLIQMYACLDVSGSRVVDGTGAEITTADRDELVPYMVTFTVVSAQSVLIKKIDVWDRAGIC